MTSEFKIDDIRSEIILNLYKKFLNLLPNIYLVLWQ